MPLLNKSVSSRTSLNFQSNLMTYKACIDWLFKQLPMYQSKGGSAYKANLSNSLELDHYLGHPHQHFKSIHVGGTNGKGSVSHMLASVLQYHGYKVGLYTSPHLKDFRERIKINGECISENAVVNFVQQHQAFFEAQQLSFFEMTVGMAFEYFKSQQVDFAIIEVGLGGRLDSTNIITPILSLITNIGLDHTQFLGDTHAKIASEKAGIIKPNIPVVIGESSLETQPVFKAAAATQNAALYVAEEFENTKFTTDLGGSYQVKNLQTVSVALQVLTEVLGYSFNSKITAQALQNVSATTGLFGRWQVLSQRPKIIADTAHNVEGLTYTLSQLQAIEADQLHIVLGVVGDKDLMRILPLFPRTAHYYFVKPSVVRGLDAYVLQQTASGFGLKGKVYDSVKEGLQKAAANASDLDAIYVGGSTFTVAEVV